MKCPKCSSETEKVTYQTIEVDRCRDCRGIWFDLLESERLAELAGSEQIDDGSPRTGRQLNRLDRIECPSCGTRMIRMVDRLQPHIWYESCEICNGVFFDAGEFTDFKEHTLLDRLKDLLSPERG